MTNFVAQRLSAELLLGQLSAEHTEADVRRVLLQVLAGAGGPQPRGRGGAFPELGPEPVKCGVCQGGSPSAPLLQGTRLWESLSAGVPTWEPAADSQQRSFPTPGRRR